MRYIAAAVFVLLCASTASSQGRFGVKAGIALNYINTRGSNAPDYSDVTLNHTFGFTYNIPAAKNFAIQPELGFVRLSGKEGLTSSTVKFDYVVVPVLFKAVTNQQNFSAYAGPQLGFLTNASMRTPTGKSNIRKDVTETDFAGVFGVQYVTTLNISVDVRYVLGMSNVFKTEYEAYKTRHQYAAVTLGYIFGKNKK
jgi:hypothetical protein